MNRLADQQSLYLRQHAANPVAWYPWGEEALERARQERRPILLSIGYSACHWCHVMAHESFEDPEIAAVMNECFVNIKVDREERPDLDKIYQLAHQALTQRSGGWPLTMFLDPETQMPFFGGTYFPPEPRHGLPAFPDMIQRVATWFDEHREALAEQNRAMTRFLAEMNQVLPGAVPELEPVRIAVAGLAEQFDQIHGGFGGAPKFPHPPNLALLLAAAPVVHDQTQEEAFEMADRSLEQMARSGLFDQIGGGFFRYCVDRDWTIPHFEKMLYDNAMLLPLYARRAAETGSDTCRQAARATVDWLRREMTHPKGGFYASLDADSEGQEGRYYVWSREALSAALDADQARLAMAVYGLDQPANFEGHAWHLVRRRPLLAVAEQLEMAVADVHELLESTVLRLRRAREQRVRPGRDDKILTAWNALMIAGLSAAGRWLGEAEWTQAARQAFDALIDEGLRDGRLLAVAGSALPGYLDDHAYCLSAALELLESDWDDGVLDVAVAVADTLLAHFQDGSEGGFFFTADDHEKLVQRPRSFNDESTPSGNGIAAQALIRLGHLLAESRYLDAAESALRGSAQLLERAPQACPSMLCALIEWHQPHRQLIVRGKLDHAVRAADLHVYQLPDQSRLAERFPQQGEFTAYLCEGRSCSEAISDPKQLLEALSQ